MRKHAAISSVPVRVVVFKPINFSPLNNT